MLVIPSEVHLMPEGHTTLNLDQGFCASLFSARQPDDESLCVAMQNLDSPGVHAIATEARLLDINASLPLRLDLSLKGVRLVSLSNVVANHAGVIRANATALPELSASALSQLPDDVCNTLYRLYQQYLEPEAPEDPRYYKDKRWAVYRWLEILPLSNVEKQYLLSPDNQHALVDKLTALLG